MCPGTWRVALVLIGCTPVFGVTSGCAMFENKAVWPMHEAVLDNARTVKLMQYVQINAALRGQKHNFAELVLCIASRAEADHPSACVGGICFRGEAVGGVVARRGGDDWRSFERFKFGKLEARANAALDKVWIVDKDAARVIASLDCASGATTGPDDEVPAWANPTGGILLKAVERESASRGAAAKDPTPSTGVEKAKGNRSESPRIDAQADAALRSLADFLAQADSFTVEAVTIAKRELRGRTFNMRMASEIAFARPNKLAVISKPTSMTLNGLPYLGERPAAGSIVCDGTNLWIRVPGDPTLARKPAPETFDELLATEVLGGHSEFGGGLLLPALVHRNPYELLTRAFREISHEGVEECEGVACHRLRMVHDTGDPMFLWISAGDTPLPRKLLRPAIPQRIRTIRGVQIESGGNPEVIEQYSAWKLNVQPPDQTFSIKRF